MSKTIDFSGSGCYVDEEFGLADYEDEYFSAPQVPTVSGCNLPDFVYNSVHYEQPSSEVLYPVMSVVHGGTTYYYYPEFVYIVPVCYYVPVSFAYEDPVGYVNPCDVEPNSNGAAEMRCEYAWKDPPEDNGKMPLCHYAPSEPVTSLVMYYEEVRPPFKSDDDSKNDDNKKNDGDKKNNDNNGASSLGKNDESMNRDCVKESSAYKKFCSEMEERRKTLSSSSQVQRTFINRGIVKDVAAYNNFCRSVEEKIKKTGSSSTGDRDHVKESPNYIKFCSEVEDRRKILDSSSVRQKTYINRGVVADVSSYQEFCRTVEDRIKKQESVETSPSSGIKKFIDKESSKGDGVAHEEKGLKFIDMILRSNEFLHVQENIENPKHFRDLLYRQALTNNPRRNNTVLLDVLPSIFEEPLILDDVTSEISCGDPTVIGPGELVSKDEITKPKQRKGRWKRFRNWWSKTFCCGCKSKDPP